MNGQEIGLPKLNGLFMRGLFPPHTKLLFFHIFASIGISFKKKWMISERNGNKRSILICRSNPNNNKLHE